MLTASHLELLTISPLFVDQFAHSLRFCNLEFDKEEVSYGWRRENNSLYVILESF